jgi:hypothetical protein
MRLNETTFDSAPPGTKLSHGWVSLYQGHENMFRVLFSQVCSVITPPFEIYTSNSHTDNQNDAQDNNPSS